MVFVLRFEKSETQRFIFPKIFYMTNLFYMTDV